MSETPLVSVIMNCFNGERYLREAIDSVFAQTFDNWEIVFWDNASTDGSASIAKSYGPKVAYFKAEKNTPLGEARNLAVKKARGSLLAFLDTDDVWIPERLEEGVKVMSDVRWSMCYAGIEEIRADGGHLRWLLPMHQSGEVFGPLLNQFDINIPTLLVRKSALEKHSLFFDPSFKASEEYNLFMRLAAVEPIATIPQYLAKWRCHESSLTGQTTSVWADERERTLNRLAADHPHLRQRYDSEFTEAYARAAYYRACHHVRLGQMKEATRALSPIRKRGLKYSVLYWLTYFPKTVWDLVHHPVLKRKIIPRLLGLAQ